VKEYENKLILIKFLIYSKPLVLNNLIEVLVKIAKIICKGLWLLTLLTESSAAIADDDKDIKQPNILFLMIDDLGYADVGFHGSDIPTPNIDSLANGGTRLEGMYAAPLCTPSRAALMTGRYPSRYGLQSFVITPGQHYGLPLDERTLASALKELGYKTHMVGKWHLGHAKKDYWPTRRGFDHYKGNLMTNIDYWTKERGGVMDWQTDGHLAFEEGYVTHLVTQEAEKVILNHDHASSPLFLYVAHPAVHSPYQAPQEALSHFTHIEDEARRTYAAMISLVDQSVGTLVRALEEKGMRENTLIIFSSDNGGVSEYPQLFSTIKGAKKPTPANNSPLRGGKASLYDGGVRVVSFANWPGHVSSGHVTEQMVHMVDWFPTLMNLAGAEASLGQKEDHPLDGKNIWDVLSRVDGVSPHEEILIDVELHQGAIRSGNMKLVKHAILPSRVELFDLEKDPSETTNIAEQFPEIRARLEQRLNEYASQNKLPLFVQEYLPYIMRDTKKAVNISAVE
jgi:arylsulfatase A-like enzyme